MAELVERLRPCGGDRARATTALNAGTVRDHIGRFRELADAGVSEVMVRLADQHSPSSIEQMASVIAAFR